MGNSFPEFLKELMRRRRRKLSQLAADLGMSHATVIRWLSGADIPRPKSCRKLADYAGVPIETVLAAAGHIDHIAEVEPASWPEFREYARRKYPNVLDDDLVAVLEELIERRRGVKQSA